MRTYTRHPTDSSLVIGDNGYVYAATRLPESAWNFREAWEILDSVPPETVPIWARMLLSGLIAGTLERIEKDTRLDEQIKMARETRQ